MRSFERVDIQRDSHNHERFAYLGTLPTADNAGRELPFTQVEISLARYLAEQSGIRACEPIGRFLEDGAFFAGLAAQQAEGGGT